MLLSKIKEVFTKEYSDDVQTHLFMEKQIHRIKLKNKSESMDDKIERLKEAGDVPAFRIKIGAYK